MAGLFSVVLGQLLGLRWGALAALLGIGLYAVFVGGDPAVLEGRTLLRTDRNGWVELAPDEKQMWVEVDRH